MSVPDEARETISALLATSSGCVRASLVLPTSSSSERPSMSQKVEFTSTNLPVISAKTIPMGALSKACWKRSRAASSSSTSRPLSSDRWRCSRTTLHATTVSTGTRPSATVAIQATQFPRPVATTSIAEAARWIVAVATSKATRKISQRSGGDIPCTILSSCSLPRSGGRLSIGTPRRAEMTHGAGIDRENLGLE